MGSSTLNEGKEKMKTLKTVSQKILFVLFAAFVSMALFGAALLFRGMAKAESVFPAGGTIEIKSGTSLKLNEKGGLRFIVKLNEEAKSYIKDNDTNDAVKLEVCIGPVALLKQSDDTIIRNNALTATVEEDKLYQVSGDENWYANVCVVSVKEANRKLDYTVKAFVVDGATVVKTSALNDMARGNFYDVTTMALLDESEDYASQILNLAGYSWLGANEEFPILIDSLALYNGLVAKINAGLDFSQKYVAIRSTVEVSKGDALNEGKALPANNYKISRVTFKNGETELGSVLVKNGEEATFAKPEDGTDGDDKLVFEKWVTENGGDTEADLNAITGDVTVYAKYRRVHANAITAFNAADITYGETPAFTATAKHGEAVITYSKTEDGEYKTWLDMENHDAGKYFAKASVVATEEYSAAEQIVAFNVNKAPNAVTDFTMADRIHCNDTPAPNANATYGTVTYLYSKTADGDFVAWENVKYDGIGNYTYYVKAAVTGTANYDAAESAVKSFRSEHKFENGVCSLGGTAHTQSGISYEIDGDVACIAGYTGNHSTEVYPLAVYEGKPVTYVKEKCAWNPNVTKIVLPASVTDFKGNSFEAASKLEYISMTGVEHITTGNNFINCSQIKTIIVNKAFNLDNQQFKKHGTSGDAQGVIYVDGSASESTFSFTAPGMNEFITGKVFYKGDATKCLQWNFDENGEIKHGAAEHNYKDGICSNCGDKDAMGVIYEYNAEKGVYYVKGYNGSNKNVTVFKTWNDGVHGEKYVKYLAFEAFRDNTTIEKVILPDSVDSLEGLVFWGCTNLAYVSMTGITNLDYASPYGGERNNNFRNCFKLSVVITSNALSSNVGQFGCGVGDTGNKKILDFYVYGESGAPSLIDGSDANNLCSGKVYYYSETEKSGCWRYVNGVATLW